MTPDDDPPSTLAVVLALGIVIAVFAVLVAVLMT
jgi:hypothetical protein